MAIQRHANASDPTPAPDGAANPGNPALTPIVAELRRIADALGRLAAEQEPLPPHDEALFQALRKWRADEARKLGMPPYIVASDRVLLAVVQRRPATLEALREVPGFGPAKTEKYGAGIVEVVATA